ncbi:Oxidoreductase OS=Streptomyces glaucescens OX=1907 GN=SGLAU_30280 PE=4 SV=1 [Streptomyces glaucescens]
MGAAPTLWRNSRTGTGCAPYDDVDTLLADVDAVAVALPPDVQAELAARAARAGRHLLLDKPLAVTPERARAVADAAREAGVASAVFFTSRFQAETEAWIAEQAATGGWFTGRAQWLAALFPGGARPRTARSPPLRGAARRVPCGTSGQHALSVLLPVLGDARRVSAAAPGPGDTVHLVLEHTGGASSTLALSLTAPPEAAGATVELRGSAGVAVLPDRSEGVVPAVARAVDALREAAGTGRPHACDAAFGLRVTEILAEAEALLTAS